MITAIFSDVHGNLPAFKAFVEATRSLASKYICLGDVVNYGPWNDECLELLYNLPGIILLEGNHERLFLGSEPISHELPLVQQFFSHSSQGFKQYGLITNLPQSTRLGNFTLTHTISNERIFANTEIDLTSNYIIGHTHHQFSVVRNGNLLINVGSVGQNRRFINNVNYVLYDDIVGTFELCEVPYPFELLLDEFKRRGYATECIEYYENKPVKY